MHVVETDRLTKDYDVGPLLTKRKRALDALSLQIEEGEVFGIIGPNGAGKTTTLKLLLGLVFPTEGTARILGKSVHDLSIRSKIGYLPENPYFYDYLTGQELLHYFGQLFGMPAAERRARTEELLRRVDLLEARNRQLRKYSKGMIQRLGIAQALLHRPRVLFLDEPMSGLDPMGRRDMAALIHQLNQEGVSVIFSTHILPDVEALCDQVAILHQGKLVRQGRLREILDLSLKSIEVVVDRVSESLEKELAEDGRSVRRLGSLVKLELAEREQLSSTMSKIQAGGAELVSVNPIKQTLEDYFVREVGSKEGGRA